MIVHLKGEKSLLVVEALHCSSCLQLAEVCTSPVKEDGRAGLALPGPFSVLGSCSKVPNGSASSRSGSFNTRQGLKC